MFVQLYSLTHPDDVQVAVDAGVEHLGFAVGDQDVPARFAVDSPSRTSRTSRRTDPAAVRESVRTARAAR